MSSQALRPSRAPHAARRPARPSSAHPVPPTPLSSCLRLLLTLLVLLPAALSAPAGAQEPAEESAELPDPYASFALGEVLGPLTEDRLFEDSEVGLQVVRVRTGEEVFAHEPDTPLVPASVTKILTAAVALRALGPAWRFRTELLTDGELTPEGVLEGNLYVRGTGDPTLVVEKLWKLTRDLKLAGIVEIEGDVVFDDTYFADDHLIPGWRKKVDLANGPTYFAPLGALSVNFNTVTILVAPGPEVGQPARVELDTPAATAVVLESELVTVSKTTRASLEIEREVDERSGAVTFRLAGRVPMESGVKRHYRAVGHPRTHFVGVFAELLLGQDIAVNGEWRIDETPDDAEIRVSLVSPPVAEILNHTNKYSSNFMAEHLLRAVGAEATGEPGTTAAGLAVLEEYLGSLGIPAGSYELVNGSGLSRDARMAPSLVNAVILDMVRDPALGPEFMASLAVGGVDGTLRRRFSGDEQVGLVRGKTGSLNGVYCLAGVIVGGDGEQYAFTFLVNGIRRTRPVRALHDRFGTALLELGREPAEGGS